jgi:hypothetical protein
LFSAVNDKREIDHVLDILHRGEIKLINIDDYDCIVC